MSRLNDLLASDRPVLIISLPRNDVDLARAALDAGAQVLKVHAGVYHHATGVTFPPLEETWPVLEEIIALARERDVPIGIVPGQPLWATAEILADLERRGFVFTDAYAHHFRAAALRGHGMDVWLAPESESGYTEAEIGALARLKDVDALEAAVVPHADYGSPLTARDLAAYARLAEITRGTPLVVPSQRKLTPQDVEPLYEVGMTNLMLGAVVLGLERSTLETAIRSMRAALDRLAVRV